MECDKSKRNNNKRRQNLPKWEKKNVDKLMPRLGQVQPHLFSFKRQTKNSPRQKTRVMKIDWIGPKEILILITIICGRWCMVWWGSSTQEYLWAPHISLLYHVPMSTNLQLDAPSHKVEQVIVSFVVLLKIGIAV